MAEENIEIGITPGETAQAEPQPTVEQPAPEAAIPEQQFNADGSTPAGSPRSLAVDAETADKVFDLLGTAHDATNWGYKGLTGKEEREAGSRTVAATEKVFAHAYAIDPERAIKKWTDINGHPPSNKLIHAAQTLPLSSPKKALDNLTTDVEKASGQIAKITANSREEELRKRKNSLTGPHGDAVARTKEYQSAVVDGMMPDRHDPSESGMFIFRSMLDANKSAQKTAQGIILSKRAKEMSIEMRSIGKELNIIEVGRVKINKGETAGISHTIGKMGMNVANRLNLVKPAGLATAVKKAMEPVGPAVGVDINAGSIAAQAAQRGQGPGLGS